MMRKVSVIGMCHGKGRIKSSIIFMLQKYAKGIKGILVPLAFAQLERKGVILPRCQLPALIDLQAFLLEKTTLAIFSIIRRVRLATTKKSSEKIVRRLSYDVSQLEATT